MSSLQNWDSVQYEIVVVITAVFACASLSPTAEGEYEMATSVTSRLEGMRKMGGDKWLSILNTDRSRHSVTSRDTVRSIRI